MPNLVRRKFASKQRFNFWPLFCFALLFLCFWFVGSIYHELKTPGRGLFGIGGVEYSYNFGKAYSWEPEYASLKGPIKGNFPETDCGALRLDKFATNPQKPTEVKEYVFSEKCGPFMSLAEFVQRFSSGVVVGELLVKTDLHSEATQVVMFDKWKSRGMLDDVRYKDVTVYDWSHIYDLILWAYLIPFIAAAAVTTFFTVLLKRTKSR